MINANRLALSGALAATVLMVAACGSGSAAPPAGASQPAASSGATAPTSSSASTPTTAAATTACSLITPAEASTALGQDAAAGTPGANGEQCTFTAAAGNLTVIAANYPDDSTAGAAFDGQRTAAKGGIPGFEDASSIGDHAFLTSMGLVEFVKGSVVVTIEALESATPSLSAMTTVGQAAAGRV
ncbi:MAG TPA: hypothetical protein VI434_09475 [Candidatus Dormibacteraeota bacterium]